MKSKKLAGLLSLIVLCGATIFLAFKGINRNVHAYRVNFVLAKTNNELIALQKDPKANLIRTVKEFDAVVQSNSTVLSKLSDEQIRDFRKTLVERKGVGIVSLHYSDIRKALSFDDFAEVMGMFGLDAKEGYWGFSQDQKIIDQLNAGMTRTMDGKIRGNKLFFDYNDYACTAPHNCQSNSGSICLSAC